MYKRIIALFLCFIITLTINLSQPLVAADTNTVVELKNSDISIVCTITQELIGNEVSVQVHWEARAINNVELKIDLDAYIDNSKQKNGIGGTIKPTKPKDSSFTYRVDRLSNKSDILLKIEGKYGEDKSKPYTFSEKYKIELIESDNTLPDIDQTPEVIKNYDLNILEIQPGESFKLQDNQKMAIAQAYGIKVEQINIDQMSMTRFIADINELNGKYDIIYIGSGTGSTAKINITEYYEYNNAFKKRYEKTYEEKYGVSLNEQGIEVQYARFFYKGNKLDDPRDSEQYSGIDITERKADEIIEFINSNQLVVFDSSIFNNEYENTNLYKKFKDYEYCKECESYEKKIISVNNVTNELNNIIAVYKTKAKRPKLELSVAGTSQEYLTINYTAYNDTNSNELMTAKLYLDTNGDGKYTDKKVVDGKEILPDEEVMQERKIDVKHGIKALMKVKVPEGYMGWKLEVSAGGEEAPVKSYITGVHQYTTSKLKEIKVLHIQPNSGNTFSLVNDLKDDKGKSLLEPLKDDYKINITEKTVNAFEASYSNSTKSQLNGIYDMIILGFKDCYGSIKNEKALADIQSFIDTGQSIMFTHDSFSYADNWAEDLTVKFREQLGQFKYERNAEINHYKYTDYVLAGAEGGQTTNKTKKINSGQITEYPYSLEDDITVSPTHFQYYKLDMERDDIVVWYTLNGGIYKWNDPTNAYYTYSVGNLTFCGTGHSNVKDNSSLAERKLFVNTIIKAANAANAAPQVNILDLVDEQLILTDQPLNLKIQGIDSDPTDNFLTYEYAIYGDNINKDQTTFKDTIDNIKNKEIYNHELTVTELDLLAEENEYVYIYAKVSDKKGAYTEKTIRVKRVNQPLKIEQEFDKEGYLLGDTAILTRTLSKKIEGGEATNIQITSKLKQNETYKFNEFNVASASKEDNDGDNWKIVEQKIDNIIMSNKESNEVSTVMKYQYGGKSTSLTTSTTVEVIESQIVVNVNDEQGRPISGAVITVNGKRYITDMGVAFINGLPTGNYSIELNEIPGYRIEGAKVQNASLSYINPTNELYFKVNGSPVTDVKLSIIEDEKELEEVTVGESEGSIEALLTFTNSIDVITQRVPIVAVKDDSQINVEHNNMYTYTFVEVKNKEKQTINGFEFRDNTLCYTSEGDYLPAGTYTAKFIINFPEMTSTSNVFRQKIQVSETIITIPTKDNSFRYSGFNTQVFINRDATLPLISAAYDTSNIENINIVARLDGTGSSIIEAKVGVGKKTMDEILALNDNLIDYTSHDNVDSTGYTSSYKVCNEESFDISSNNNVKWINFKVSQGGVYTIYTKEASGMKNIKHIIITPSITNMPNIS